MLSAKEERYAYLDYKAHFEPLNDEEMKEAEKIQEELELVPCDQCKGEGYFYNPSIIGYGTEEAPCSKCSGLGELNHSEELKKEMLKGR